MSLQSRDQRMSQTVIIRQLHIERFRGIESLK